MLDAFLNFIKKQDSDRLAWLKRDLFGETFRQRVPLLCFLIGFQMLYFPINQFLSARGGGTNVGIPAIDGNMPLFPFFALPYALGFAVMPIFPMLAAWKFPRRLFQEYMIAFFAIMVCGYSIWILFPAYVVKTPITGDGFFTELVRMMHNGDSTYGTYNAVPSSHVYYVTLGMCFFVMYRKRLLLPFVTFAVLNALSTMFTHQHYFIDVITGIALVTFVYELTHYVLLPAVQRWESRLGIYEAEAAID